MVALYYTIVTSRGVSSVLEEIEGDMGRGSNCVEGCAEQRGRGVGFGVRS